MRDLQADNHSRECQTKSLASFFFGDSHAANRVVLFEDENFYAGPGQITRTRQAIVPRANDDCVIMMGHG